MKTLILLIPLLTALLHAELLTLPKRMVEVTPTKTKSGTLNQRFMKYTDCFCSQKTLEIASDTNIELSSVCTDFESTDEYNVFSHPVIEKIEEAGSITYRTKSRHKSTHAKTTRYEVDYRFTLLEKGLYQVEIHDYQWEQRSTHFMVSDSLSKQLREVIEDCGDFDG